MRKTYYFLLFSYYCSLSLYYIKIRLSKFIIIIKIIIKLLSLNIVKLQDAIEIANDTPFGLAAGLFTRLKFTL